MEVIPHSRPWITPGDIAGVSEVLASAMLGQGARVRLLEQRLAEWLGAADGVAVGSGAAGIWLGLHGLRVGVGDEVILPTYVCRSVLEAVLSVGATPVLCDVGPDWVITASEVDKVRSHRTRAVVAPHLYGIFADIGAIRSLGLPVIEDCAQAVGAKGQRPLMGDVAVLSLHPTKCLTAGEGGVVVTSDPEALLRMRAFRDGSAGIGGVYAGRLLSPMSELAAALALSQLERYESGLARRQEIAAAYIDTVNACNPDLLQSALFPRSMFFRFPLRVPGGLAACQEAFSALGVQVRRGVDELLHRALGLPDAAFPNAVKHFETTVSVPIYPALSQHDELRCRDAMAAVLPNISH
ncbi:MAG: DegT/DnrJ/EryC1/StrS family aminotransferase [Rhodocyclaceae bacterium]